MALHVAKEVAELPNIKRIFIPDPGYMMYDADLSGADAQVVAWEADDAELKTLFRSGANVHIKNAEDNFGPEWAAATGHHKSLGTPKGAMYYDSKRAVHLTNYVGSAKTLAVTLGWTVAKAASFQANWFRLHPGIKLWHDRVLRSLRLEHRVRNEFGFHRIYLDRPDSILAEAVAWNPQSTIAETCFRGALQLEQKLPYIEMLMQTHDSVTFQVPMRFADNIDAIKDGLLNEVPYSDPLIIQWKLTRSEKSWGDCGEFKLAA